MLLRIDGPILGKKNGELIEVDEAEGDRLLTAYGTYITKIPVITLPTDPTDTPTDDSQRGADGFAFGEPFPVADENRLVSSEPLPFFDDEIVAVEEVPDVGLEQPRRDRPRRRS
ncbi:MAG TPA: hypothetical protein PLB92_03875 [Rhodoglobus sp.]|nr:hypothetical protein [Rhodoglobus sp.]